MLLFIKPILFGMVITQVLTFTKSLLVQVVKKSQHVKALVVRLILILCMVQLEGSPLQEVLGVKVTPVWRGGAGGGCHSPHCKHQHQTFL